MHNFKLKLFAVMFTLAKIGFAQNEIPIPTSKGAQTTSGAKVVPAMPSVASIQRFTPGFTGQDIESMARRLMVTRRPRSEFETTEQYRKRLLLEKDDPNEFTFVLPVSDEDGGVVNFKYDADSETMTANLWGVLPWLRYAMWKPYEYATAEFQVLVKRRLISSRRYIGSNAFGVKTVVSSKEYDEFDLALDSNELLSAQSPKFSWPMKIADAKAGKPFLRVAALCILLDDLTVYRDEGHHEPSVDDPREITTHYYYLPAVLEQVIIFDPRSGRVLKTFGEMQ